MTDRIASRLRDALGPDLVNRDPAGRPRLAPESADQLARVLALASSEGWRVRIEGRGTWCPADAPADLAVSTAGLTRIIGVAARDLVATVEAGVPVAELELALGAEQMWLPWDPPGRPDRSVGSVVATACAGPLRHGLGAVRDHVLGCTVITGDGRVLRAGGAVVKNVAGYDLTRLQVGAFGGFGIVTEVHLRLRAVPEADVTWIATGERDALTAAARDLMAGGVEAAAVELLSPALAARPEWLLAVRLVGPRAGVGPEADRLGRLASLPWTTLAAEAAGQLWRGAARGGLGGVAAIRMGALLDGIDETLDLLAERLDLGLVSVGAGTGAIRWSGDAAPERLLALRAALATREIPVTLERAPWPLRRAVGHFGAYREGVGPLVEGLREVFDPRRALLVPVEAPNA